MALFIRATSLAVTFGLGLVLAGCAGDPVNMFGGTTTASIPEKPAVDPACVTLTSQIDTLKKDGVAEKVEKAAARKYKMKTADLAKAAQLNKANAEFQSKCSALAPMTTAQASSTQVSSSTQATGQSTAQVAAATPAKASTASIGSQPVAGDQ